MAVINKIRKRSGLILTFVGVGLLAFIIPVDKIMQLFTGEQDNGIGLFEGKDVVSQDAYIRNDDTLLKFVDYVGEEGKYKGRVILERYEMF